MTREECACYQRGYIRARKALWPESGVPVPPDDVIAQLIAALRRLRDEYDSLCATFSPDDEVVIALDSAIQQADASLEVLHDWLIDETNWQKAE